ncbi:MAG: hypothetical protein JWO94_3738 [Verrucomicrobiaceae bacterium]|nr:hypothetical protein [Verrucomicrobiaceae bacterium]
MIFARSCLLLTFAVTGLHAQSKDFEEVSVQGMVFIRIPAGTFTMGTTAPVQAALEAAKMWTRFENVELPAHEVTLSRPFLIGKYEVTQKEWKTFARAPKKTVFSFNGDDLPAESVSFEDVTSFITGMNKKAGKQLFRLPTEAEWEYCARSGSAEAYGNGKDGVQITGKTLGDYAWFAATAGGKPHPVGKKLPNAWGLHDMMGNVWEWCRDWYLPTFYTAGAATNPLNKDADNSSERVIRGGSWFVAAGNLRAAFRGASLPDARSAHIGFRLVCEP